MRTKLSKLVVAQHYIFLGGYVEAILSTPKSHIPMEYGVKDNGGTDAT